MIAGTNAEAVVSITDDDTGVSFEQMAYDATEGQTVDVKVTLSSAVTREITIPLNKSDLGGVSGDDYSGVPDNVIFGSGVTEKTIAFVAFDDEIDDDGEGVKLLLHQPAQPASFPASTERPPSPSGTTTSLPTG